MTVEESMPGKHDCGADAAAYVLGALEPEEAEAFGRHLATCVVCRDEVAAFEHTANALAMAPPQHPAPRGLKRRVMRAVRESDAEAQAAPVRRSVFSVIGIGFPANLASDGLGSKVSTCDAPPFMNRCRIRLAFAGRGGVLGASGFTVPASSAAWR